MKFLKSVLVLCLLISLCAAAFAQNKSKEKDDKKQPKPLDVKMNLLVLNEQNGFINDLRQEEIKVFEDGIEQKITYFAKKESALNIGLLMDNTGSMRDLMEETTYVGKTIVDNLRDTDEAFVVRFVSSETVEIIQEWTSDKSKLNLALESMFVQGGQSAVLDAIYLSAQELLKREAKNKNKRYAILLVSDAEDRDSFYKYNDVINLFKDTDIQIFVLSYADGAPQRKKKAQKLSHLLSLDTGGTTYSLTEKRKPEELNEVLKKMVIELRSNYVVGYTSTNPKRDGATRKLTVEITPSAKGEKRRVITRESFVVPEN